jgi:hypothetical protein
MKKMNMQPPVDVGQQDGSKNQKILAMLDTLEQGLTDIRAEISGAPPSAAGLSKRAPGDMRRALGL